MIAIPPVSTTVIIMMMMMSNITFSMLTVWKVLTRLKPILSMSPDGIPIYTILLKKLSLSLSGLLSYLFEQSFSLVFIPSVWKTAKIVPLLQQGSALKVSNYIQTNIINVYYSSKILERIISDQLQGRIQKIELGGRESYNGEQ